MKHIFGRQNIRELVNYSSFLCDGSTINVFLWNVLRAKMKVYTFFISNSIFHLSLRLLRQDVNEVPSQPKLVGSRSKRSK